MIDTHTHIFEEYYNDIGGVITRAKEVSVSPLIISGCDRKTIHEAISLINKYNDLYATIGYHPDEIDVYTEDDLLELEQLVKSNSKVIGIGEIGLDYYYGKDGKEKQKILFEKQLQIAEKINVPVVIHSRDAVKDTIDILKKYKVRGIMHCFSGSLEVAKEYISMGYLLGIGGVLTFKNSNLKEVIKEIPMESIVLETDAPYLAPEPYRGKTNESSYIVETAKFLAKIKEISIEEVDKITTNNVLKLFDLK